MRSDYGWLQRLAFFLTGWLGHTVISLYYTTVHIVNDDEVQRALNHTPHRPGIYPFWHAHQLSLVHHFSRTGAAILVSRSRDGEYIARIAQRAGFRPVRGSSSRAGPAGLKQLIALARAGGPVAITPDGPRGPRYSIQPGVIALARNSERTIRPLAIGLSDFWQLPSWDRFRIPKPFSWGYAAIGEPLAVPPDADAAAMEALAEELRRRLLALEEHADTMARRLKRRSGRVDLLDRA